jgi:hypothetical protein
MQTLAQLQARRTAYLAAETAILTGGQEYGMSAGPDGRNMKRASLTEIRAAITQLDAEIARAEARSTGRTRSLSPSPVF